MAVIGKRAVSSIVSISFLGTAQAHNLLAALSIPTDKPITIAECKEKIAECPEIVAKAIDNKIDTINILFCFNYKHEFICCQDELSFSSHSICLPQYIVLKNFSQLSFTDKVKLLTQVSLADSNGMLQLPWSFLCKDQLVSAAATFSIKLTTTQIQNCSNVSNILAAKIRKSDYFKDQYGSPDSFPLLGFDFSTEDILDCIGHGKDTYHAEVGVFWMPSLKIKIPGSVKTKINLPGTLPTVSSALALDSVSLEQLKSISSFYKISLDINRRVTKGSIIEVIKSCHAYILNASLSPLKDAVIFCFNDSNEVLCTISDLVAPTFDISLQKKVQLLYKTPTVPTQCFLDKHKILLQNALALTNCRNFSVPWCVLTFSQKLEVAADYLEEMLPESFSEDERSGGSALKTIIENSEQFKKSFGPSSLDSVLFAGSMRTPLDITIHKMEPQLASESTNSEIFLSLFTTSSQHISNLEHIDIPNPTIGHDVCLQDVCHVTVQTPQVVDTSEENSQSVKTTLTTGSSTNQPPSCTLNQQGQGMVHNQGVVCGKGTVHVSQVDDPSREKYLYSTTTKEQKDMFLCESTGETSSPMNFSIILDDNFTLASVKNASLGKETIDHENSKCLTCNNSCKNETLCCAICQLEVHYSCYPTETSAEGKYDKPMNSSTFKTLNGLNNVTWICKGCNSTNILDKILQLASNKIKEKVRLSIGQINLDMDKIEQEVVTSCTTKLSTAGETRDTATTIALEVDKEPEILSTKGPFKTLDAEDFEKTDIDQISDMSETPRPRGNIPLHSTPVSSQHSTSDPLLPLDLDSHGINNSTNVIKIDNYCISWSTKEDQKAYIDENICQLCLVKCPSNIISCYICSLKVHAPCKNLPLISGLIESDITKPSDLQHLKWFCKSCKGISFKEAGTLISEKTLKKAKKYLKEDFSEELRLLTSEKEASIPNKVSHFPNFQEEICRKIKDVISSEVTSLKEDLCDTLKEHLTNIPQVPNCSNNNITFQENNTHQLEKSLYAETAALKSPNIVPSKHAVQQGSSTLVNPDLSVIIKNALSPKFRISRNCKTQFNKHFAYMRIKSIFSTQAGNIIVELFELEDVNKVIKEWRSHFFCTENDKSSPSIDPGTEIILMSKSARNVEVIMKHINKNWSEVDIKAELESSHNNFTNPVIKRFIKRDETILNTVKIDFTCHKDYTKAISAGVFLHGEHFMVEPFIKQPKAHQCYKCKRFGHPAKWCSRKIRCEYCSEEGHAGKDCILRGEIHEYICSNCNGQHSSKYSLCPEFIKHIRRPLKNNSKNHD